MKQLRILLVAFFCCVVLALGLHAENASAPAAHPSAPQPASSSAQSASTSATENKDNSSSSSSASTANAEAQKNTTNAVAANYALHHPPPASHLLEGLVDRVLAHFDLDPSENTPTRYGIALGCVIVGVLLRWVVIGIGFRIAKRLAARTETTLDDRMLPAIQRPVSVLIVVLGFVLALRVLKLSLEAEFFIDYGTTIAVSLVIFWLLYRGFAAVLDHAEEVARDRQLGIAAFSPWIKKTLITFFVIVGVLILLQSLGYNVKAFLAGLGIGGLAFALAAQDTLANLFGSVVIAIDQPFKIGEFVQVGANAGAVEDIGLRSTRLRKADKSLLVIPNKTVASEVIVNLSRFTQRRVEQTIGVTYDSPGEQVAALVEDIRTLLKAEKEIEQPSIFVQFVDFGPSSLVIAIQYNTLSPDYFKQCALKQRLNLAIMSAVSARNLAFALPTQSLRFAGPWPTLSQENHPKQAD
ncbi:MAG TPA: mechanosensitive ion channel family protein [Opitutaceae bacterium]